MTSDSAGYSSDWIGEPGLNLDPAYCISIVRGVEPRMALRRLGVDDASIRTARWPELVAQADEIELPHVGTAAFVLGEHTVVVEENGYRGRLAEWNQPLSRGTEVVNVYLGGGNGDQELVIVRDGEELAFVDGDEPEHIDTDDEELAARLIELSQAALKPWEDDSAALDDSFDDGWVDLLQVACGYAGLRPTVSDVGAPMVGAPVRV